MHRESIHQGYILQYKIREHEYAIDIIKSHAERNEPSEEIITVSSMSSIYGF